MMRLFASILLSRHVTKVDSLYADRMVGQS